MVALENLWMNRKGVIGFLQQAPGLRGYLPTGGFDLRCDGRKVDQFIHRRQFGDEASELGQALILNEQVRRGLATPEGRGLGAWRDHCRHLDRSTDLGVREGGFEECPSGWWKPNYFTGNLLATNSLRRAAAAAPNCSI